MNTLPVLCILIIVTTLYIPSCTPSDDHTQNMTPSVDMNDVFLADINNAHDITASVRIDPFALSTKEPGPFSVGYRSWEHTYIPVAGGPSRTITLNAWYPTLAPAIGRAPRYLGIFTDPQSIADAPIASSIHGDTYPVHVYSHGHLGFGGTGADLLRHFASHGWIAIAPDHTENTLRDNRDPRHPSMYYKRGRDIQASLDALDELDLNHPLYKKANTNSVLMTGYSFGVHTAWSIAGATFDTANVQSQCSSPEPGGDTLCSDAEIALFAKGLFDTRVKAVILQAGSIKKDWFGDHGQDTVTLPLLSMTGSADPVQAQAQYDSIATTDVTWIDIEGACHSTFGIGSCNTLDKDTGNDLINTYALAFARHHVLHDDTPEVFAILNHSDPVDRRIHFTRKNP